MPICENCGVELKTGTAVCPLCGLVLNETSKSKGDSVINHPGKDNYNFPDLSHWIWELFTFLMLAGFIVVFMVDFSFGMSIGWSKIPLLSILYTWLAVTFSFKIKKGIYKILLLEFVLLMFFLWSLDLLIPGKPWFLDFILPFLIFTGFIIELTIAIIYKFKLQTYSIVALSFISLGIFLLCLEAVLSRFLLDQIILRWSLVACACLIPISGFILYLKHKIRKKGKDLEKYFHT